MDAIRRDSLAVLRRRLIRKAEDGDVDAMMEYCSTFPDVQLATAPKEDRKRVLRFLRTAAKKGCAEAWCNLGASYYGGDVLVKRDFKKAVTCYEKSAALGCDQAMINLGYCHYTDGTFRSITARRTSGSSRRISRLAQDIRRPATSSETAIVTDAASR